MTVANDSAAPTVAITSPAAGAVAGNVTVTAAASDDVGVAGVQFLLDGAPLGAEDTTAPYEVSWDTATAANGAHVLTAVARDAAGHTDDGAAVSVTVANDTAAPTVAVTSPGAGTVAGTVDRRPPRPRTTSASPACSSCSTARRSARKTRRRRTK